MRDAEGEEAGRLITKYELCEHGKRRVLPNPCEPCRKRQDRHDMIVGIPLVIGFFTLVCPIIPAAAMIVWAIAHGH